ncbi:hypothetical protein ACRE_057800 [Hapsidospora chrysogenum ATCC 11550]|uniref:Uncharacterized protein n=1 Tax=Hapsidospora chrysogenum (strain ATCC 11550 / CBS 779.69 / DSM 880 / IAM 14645 / JCM 23072 / IMI 49137) TaxID=857340 RepID=A0A086T272_HAPC1|nr:hypothetical protein ACRE_057800 [Hapsidospora chrysogenum ATCC 11550]
MSSEPPLPSKSHLASLSNNLSLLKSRESSLLRSMNLSAPSTTRRTRTRPQPRTPDESTQQQPQQQQQQQQQQEEEEEEEEEESSGFGGETDGLGYVRRKRGKDEVRDTPMSRLLGKRKGAAAGDGSKWTRKMEKEESSEDEEGRGSLGKRKRERKRVREEEEEEEEEEEQVTPVVDEENEVAKDDATQDVGVTSAGGKDVSASQQQVEEAQAPPKKKKKRNKNKRKASS